MNQYTAVLDIGSSKVICVICSAQKKDGGIVVHGSGVCEYSGYKHGEIENEQSLKNAISGALTAAEAEAKRRVKDVSVGVSAPFIKLIINSGKTTPRSRSMKITNRDVDDLMNTSLEFEPPVGYELIHSTPVEFLLDGEHRHSNMPIGLTARELSAPVSHVYVQSRLKTLVSDALLKVGLDADMYVAVPLSEGLFVIPEAKRSKHAILIDVGATHTDVCVMLNSALVAYRTIDIGGVNFTGDLCYGLGLTRPVGENVKRRYVYSLDYQDAIDTIPVPGGGTMRVEHAAIQYIIEARTHELAQLIKEAIYEMGVSFLADTSVYLSGGGIALMRGSCEFLERELGTSIGVQMPKTPRLSSPNYTSAFSVMDFVIHAADVDNLGRLEETTQKGWKKLRNFFIR